MKPRQGVRATVVGLLPHRGAAAGLTVETFLDFPNRKERETREHKENASWDTPNV